MKITIENNKLAICHNFLRDLSLKGKKSVSRTKMMKLVLRKNKEFEEARKEIIESYAKKDVDGKAIIDANDQYEFDVENRRLANKELTKLSEEKAVIEYGEFVNDLRFIEEHLNEYDEEISGDAAEAFATLLDAFENKEEK